MSRGFSEDGEIPILRHKSIRLIKRVQARLKSLLTSFCFIRGIREKVIRSYRTGKHQNPPCSLTIAPTDLQWQADLGIDDYRWKCGNKKAG